MLKSVFLQLALLVATTAAWAGGNVKLMRAPEGGIQPQAAMDENGTLHLIYFKGEPGSGDVFYTRIKRGERGFTAPLRVNSQAASVIATGTVRGAHIALGRQGRVHVAWMGATSGAASGAAAHGSHSSHPMFYARLDDRRAAFESQRNVMQFAEGLDGGGSLAADAAGNVWVAWHAGAGEKGEDQRRVWVARSSDDGRTFARETAAWDEPTGACGCCGMRAFAERRGGVYMLYRSATEKTNRDMVLLTSNDGGRSFQGRRIHRWQIGACPMSTASFAAGSGAVVAAWETEWQVYFATLSTATFAATTTPANRSSAQWSEPVSAPGAGGKRKHPVVARNARGETILVWTEGTAWKKSGTLAWQVFDAEGRPIGEKGEAADVPVWSLAAVVADPAGGFTVIY